MQRFYLGDNLRKHNEGVGQWESIGGKQIKGTLLRGPLVGHLGCSSAEEPLRLRQQIISDLFFQGSGEEPGLFIHPFSPLVVKCCFWGINPPVLLVCPRHASESLRQRNRTWDRKPLMCVESEPQNMFGPGCSISLQNTPTVEMSWSVGRNSELRGRI